MKVETPSKTCFKALGNKDAKKEKVGRKQEMASPTNKLKFPQKFAYASSSYILREGKREIILQEKCKSFVMRTEIKSISVFCVHLHLHIDTLKWMEKQNKICN